MPKEELSLDIDRDDLTTDPSNNPLEEQLAKSQQELDEKEDKSLEDPPEVNEEGDDGNEGDDKNEGDDQNDEAPSMVTRYSPGVAEIWDTLNETQRQKVMEDVMTSVETASTSQQNAGQDNGAADRGGSSERGGSAGAEEVNAGPQIPDALTKAEREAMLEVFGDEDDPGRIAFQKLLDRDQQMLDYTGHVLDVTSESIGKIDAERALGNAMATHTDEIGEVSRDEWDAIAASASEVVEKGRSSNYDDAVSLVLYEATRGNKPKDKPTNEDVGSKSRRATPASSFAGSSRKKGKGAKVVATSLDDAMEQD